MLFLLTWSRGFFDHRISGIKTALEESGTDARYFLSAQFSNHGDQAGLMLVSDHVGPQ